MLAACGPEVTTRPLSTPSPATDAMTDAGKLDAGGATPRPDGGAGSNQPNVQNPDAAHGSDLAAPSDLGTPRDVPSGERPNADAAAFESGAPIDGTNSLEAGALRCNGHAALCDRRFDEVVFPATHNSMSNADD